ncbi:MAG TPA: VOC family protein [Candidatus Limnocylindrales bacterium]|nr:VOC family protein [Candidatus Limnocylindrales bacterium]
MAQAATAIANKPVWVDLASSDPAKSRDFYTKVFGWQVEVSDDPQYGGYGLAKVDGKDAAGIGGKMSPDMADAWTLYIGTADAEETARKVEAAGGKVVAPPFAVGDQGRMAVFQDSAGAYIAVWETSAMGGFQAEGSNTYGWAELNARGVQNALPFYRKVFGWTAKSSEMGEGQPPYNEFQLDGESIAGAWEMNADVPTAMPSYWMVYFGVDDVDGAYRKALDAGAREMLPPQDFPGGRFAIVNDPLGAMFGILRMSGR